MVTASKLYDKFGEDLVKILESEPHRIQEASFLTPTQVESILSEWEEASESRTSAIFLTDIGFSSSQVRSIYEKFGKETRRLIKKDPYITTLCGGVSFQSADNAAFKLGFGPDSHQRIQAMVKYAVGSLSQSEGHVYCTSDQIQSKIEYLFKRSSLIHFSDGPFLTDSKFYPILNDLISDGDLISENGRIYTKYLWNCENSSSDFLGRALNSAPKDFGDIENLIKEFEEVRKVTLSDEQRAAVMMLKDSTVGVVSGFPGTGKTLLVSAFVYILEKAKLDYKLLSPTGIAAKRLSQVTGKPASTIHRALGYDSEEWSFDRSNKYIVDAIIVDETSMIGMNVFHHLLDALHSSTILIFVGDPEQLPSVDAGCVLKSLISCSDIPHVSLTRIYRQDKLSDVVTVAHSILNGQPVDTRLNKKSEFVFLNFPQNSVIGEICRLSSLMKEKKKQFQIISPMYDGELGVDNLNSSLRLVLNPQFNADLGVVSNGKNSLYVGDRVMVIKNDYEKNIFNGDTGKITRISLRQNEVEVKIFNWFDAESTTPSYSDKTFIFKVEDATQMLRVAYACTTHKCQGNEIDYVIVPMTFGFGPMLYRKLIYTTITRTREKVFIVGDPIAFNYAISNVRDDDRNSNLSEMISTAKKNHQARMVLES